jgi:hypothetical protein
MPNDRCVPHFSMSSIIDPEYVDYAGGVDVGHPLE